MAITPQAIKDQEFQVKFRGYDTIEVKAYLELIAEEFFERLEELRQQVEEIETLTEDREELEGEKESLKTQLASMQETSEVKVSEFAQKDEHMTALKGECDELREEIRKLEEEKAEKDREITAAEERIQEKEGEKLEEKARNVQLQQELEVLKKTSEKLGEAEVDFKSTLLMAQKFSHDIKEKSEAEAQEILDIAIQEAEKLRQDTFNQLARYPKEIEKLKEKRDKVRADLAAALTICLENLDVFAEVGTDVEVDDMDDLYQSIDLPFDDSESDSQLDSISVDLGSSVSSKSGVASLPIESEEKEMAEESEAIVP